MEAIAVSDIELAQGIDDVSQWLPSPSLPNTQWSLAFAEQIFYDRETLEDTMRLRHLYAIRAARSLSPVAKIDAMARLIALWYPITGGTV